MAFTEALAEAGITGSIGSVGDALDNALMESTVGLYKTEVIDHERMSWSSWRQVEAATAEWVHWYNHDRLHSSVEDLPPEEFEQIYYDQNRRHSEPAAAQTNPPLLPGRFKITTVSVETVRLTHSLPTLNLDRSTTTGLGKR